MSFKIMALLSGQHRCLFPMTEEETKAFNDAKKAADDSKAEIERLKAEIEKGKTKPPENTKTQEDPDKDKDLRAQADKARAEADKAKATEKTLKRAWGFNAGLEGFMKTNKELVPAKFEDIITQAKKKTYDSETEQAAAVQSALIEEFFAVQANLDLLTVGQKSQFEEFSKLSVKAKEAKASELYENIFEPALETLRKVKKAEELGKSRQGTASSSPVEDGYRKRLIEGSQKMYLNKQGA